MLEIGVDRVSHVEKRPRYGFAVVLFSILFLLTIVIVQLYEFRTSFERELHSARAAFKSKLEFMATSFSVGYFQWNDMYNAVVTRNFKLADDILKFLVSDFPIIERATLVPGKPPDDIWEIDADDDRIFITFQITDSYSEKVVDDYYAVVEISAQRVLDELMLGFLKLNKKGRELAYGIRVERLVTIREFLASFSTTFLGAFLLFVVLYTTRETALKKTQAIAKILETQNKALQKINELNTEILSGKLSYDTLLKTAVDIIPGAQAGSVLLKSGDFYIFASCYGYDFEQLSKVKFAPSDLAQGVSGEVRVVKNLGKFDKEHFKNSENLEILEKYGRVNELKAMLSVPVKVEDELVAFLNVDNFENEDAFTEESVRIATVLANQLGVLFTRLKLEDELAEQKNLFEHLSTHDMLTNLPNRRYLLSEADRLISLAQREHKRLCVLYLDLKGFKPINDKYGHKVGDYVLQQVARRMEVSVRKSDVVARVGGDEFVFVIYDCKDWSGLVSRLIQELEREIELEDLKLQVSGNFGVAVYPDDGTTFDQLLLRSDMAMYRAKTQGLKVFAAGDL